jgi:signal transduction histidine kinase
MRRHEHRGGPHWLNRPIKLRLKGLHHRIMGILLLTTALGVGGGFALRAAYDAHWHWTGIGCIALGLWFSLGPLGWIATMRIAKPVRELARVAGDLREGHLERRRDLGGEGEVGEVADALRGMADRLVDQLRAQRALMAAVSHELRSPLGRVRILTELLREGTAPPGAYDDLQREVDGMDALVGDLLAGARIDFEAVAPRRLEVRDVALRALEVAGVPADAVSFTGEPGQLVADATLLARALVGLLDNARRYGGKDVRLLVHDLGDRVQFTVEDDGPGFAPGDEVRAFEPFWRGPSTGGPAPKGEGLGLALVRQIAGAHRGTAGARNGDGGGARVWITMPRGSADAQAQDGVAPHAERDPAAAAG